MTRDVQQALDETAQLAQRIYPALLNAGGLAAALRSAAAGAGIRVSVDVPAGANYPPEVAARVYFCCLEAFEHVRRPDDDHGARRCECAHLRGRRGRARTARAPRRPGPPPMRNSTGCATASKRSADSWRSGRGPAGVSHVLGSLPLSR